jgi:glutamate formiminotransferase / formiminotetrahydrofolate cyclodeaminase
LIRRGQVDSCVGDHPPRPADTLSGGKQVSTGFSEGERLVECVPNFSEGRDAGKIGAIRDAIAAVAGVRILDVSSDASHNRTVITFVAPLHCMVDAAFAAVREAREHIDLREHEGVHPRMGATDVLPLIPLGNVTMEECVTLANRLGERVGTELDIPVYLYERAATRPSRKLLADVRRGGFEAIRGEIGTDPTRAPDYGPLAVHPSAGAIAIGARPLLIAFNMYIGGADRLDVAREIAATVRERGGGLASVRALGLLVDGQAQVSINLTDTEVMPLHRVFDEVQRQARARGADITHSELVGLIPERVVYAAGAAHLGLRNFSPSSLLEHRIRESRVPSPRLHDMVDALAAPTSAPGGGTATAIVAALGAALASMAAGLTAGREKYAGAAELASRTLVRTRELRESLLELAAEDARAYADVIEARRLPRDTPEAVRIRALAIDRALITAARAPLRTARAASEAAELAAGIAREGNRNAAPDAAVGAVLAAAACRAAVMTVEENVRGMSDPSGGAGLVAEARALRERAERATAGSGGGD